MKRRSKSDGFIMKGGKIMELVMSFEKNDEELIAALQQQFGDKIEYAESKNFDGLEILITAVVPVTALTVQIIDFILDNFCDRDKKSDSNDKKRVIIDSDGSIDLRGYNEEEVRKIIDCYFRNQYDKRK